MIFWHLWIFPMLADHLGLGRFQHKFLAFLRQGITVWIWSATSGQVGDAYLSHGGFVCITGPLNTNRVTLFLSWSCPLGQRQWLAFLYYLLSVSLCVTLSAMCFPAPAGSRATGHLWHPCSPTAQRLSCVARCLIPVNAAAGACKATHLHACHTASPPSPKAILNTCVLITTSFLLCFSWCFC